MTALRSLSQQAEIPTDGIADKSVTSRKNFIDVQWNEGNNDAYVQITQGNILQRSAGVSLTITYTPSVDCYWEVVAKVGICQITDGSGTSYRMDLQIRALANNNAATPATGQGDHTIMTNQHRVGQQRFIGRHSTALFQLTAGVPYTADIYCIYIQAGTWYYHANPAYLSLFGKAWAR